MSATAATAAASGSDTAADCRHGFLVLPSSSLGYTEQQTITSHLC